MGATTFKVKEKGASMREAYSDAEIIYKSSNNESLGEYIFFGWAAE